MDFGTLVTLCVLSTCFTFAFGFPSHGSISKQEILDKFVEILNEDKELASAFENVNFDHEHAQLNLRNKRQADDAEVMEDVTEVNGNEAPEGPPKPGFIDRVLVFAMELLQRFLKWLNSDN